MSTEYIFFLAFLLCDQLFLLEEEPLLFNFKTKIYYFEIKQNHSWSSNFSN